MKNRDSFTSRFGFILACIGSAVGMGNLWMFPTRVSLYGGGSFIIPYFIFVVLIGATGVIGEMSFGRAARSGPVNAFGMALESKGKRKLGEALGLIPMAGALAMAIGYTVVMGWILKYAVGTFTGSTLAYSDVDGYAGAFGGMASAFGNNAWQIGALVICLAITMLGIGKGIEKANKVMMPLFYILFVGLAIYIALQPGSAEGYKYIFRVDPVALKDPMTWIYALGQAFFSLSITGSGMIVYGSYLKKDEDIPKASVSTAFFDTCAAMVAALAVMPAVFAFGIEPHSGPSLLFITLPGVFGEMPMGQLVAVVFFLSVLFAGITSLMNMFEAVCESWQTRFNIKRITAVIICGAITLGVGLFMENADIMGKWMDFITILVTPFGALLGAIAVYYILGFDDIKSELELGRKKALPAWFGPVAKYIYVPVTVIVFILGLVYGGIG